MKKLLDKIRTGLKDQDLGRLAENFVSLSLLQIVNYILPLVTLPYLARVLGVEKFGLVMFASSFVIYFGLITEYGFNLSATREISVFRDDKKKISEIFFSVMIARIILLLISAAILTVMVFSIGKFSADRLLYFYTFGMVIGNVLFPVWFFQGMERMKYITVLNIAAKMIFTILIFVFVRGESDYIYVPIFNSLGYIIAGVISLYTIFADFKLPAVRPTVSGVYGHFSRSSQYFLSRVSVSVYTNSNTFVIGLFLGNSIAGFYSAAEKLFTALWTLYTPLTTALYPYMCKARNLRFYKRIFTYSSLANLAISGLVFIFSGVIVKVLYGDGFQVTVGLLRIFSILSAIIVPAILLGYPLLGAMGQAKYVNYSVIIASVAHLVLLLAVIPIMNVYLVTAISVLTQMVVIIIRLYAVRKFIPLSGEIPLCAE